MKYLNTMIDNLLNREYKLYQINAREIYERLNRDYKIPKVKLQMFNSESKLVQQIQKVQYCKKTGNRNNEREINDLKEIVEKIGNNNNIDKMKELGAGFGYELMPIAISIDGDIENPGTKIELIDGFRRMFCVNEIPDIDILVKVYEKLDDREWINSMIVYNSWKFAKGEKSKVYMDRGFQLGLYHRYGLRLYAMESFYMYYDMFKLTDIYTQGKDLLSYHSDTGSTSMTYITLWNNNEFINDLEVMYKIFNHTPVFKYETSKNSKEYNVLTDVGQHRTGISRLYEVFISLIGEIRRLEYENAIVNRVPFDMDIFYNYLSDKKLQKEFIELCSKTIDGHIINRINYRLREGIKERVYTGMGYKYIPPQRREVSMRINIEDIIY